MKNYFVNLETRLKYKILESDASTVILVPAFVSGETEVKLTWNELYSKYKPLRKSNRENEGWD